MNNTSIKKYFPFIALAILLVSMILIVWLGIIPFRKNIVEKADEIQEFFSVRENRQKQLSKLPELKSQFNLIEANEKKLDIILPESRVVDFVKILEELAKETKTEITIQSQDKGAIQEKGAAKKPVKKSSDGEKSDAPEKNIVTIMDSLPYDRYLRINIMLVGEYRDIVTFLNKMETLPYALDVVGVKMKVRESDDKKESAPDPRNNPFLLSPGLTLSTVPEETEVPTGRIEAVFDTAVYVNKEE